jgi:DNA repair photolyase
MARAVQFSLFPGVSAPSLRDVADAVREAGLEGLPDAARRADEARYQEVTVRSGLTQTTGMPFRWALNPYRGCTHACEYCYARKYQPHLELGVGDDFSSVILVKRNLPDVLARELARPRWARETVAVGTATDPYQPIEGHYRITRRCLELLVTHRTPFTVVTKGPLVVRDGDVFVEASRHAGCQVVMSVASVDDDVWRRLEPGTAPPRQRLKAIGTLAGAGVDAGVLMMPLLPGISTSTGAVARTLEAIAESGARFLGASVARLDVGVREHFFAVLAREYPDLVDGYARLYRRAHAPGRYQAAVKTVVRSVRARLTG